MLLFERAREYDDNVSAERCPEGISPLLASLLRARGAVTADEMHAFLYPSLDEMHDPFLLNDMDKAKARVEKAMKNGEHICIYGDYDVDGMCAASILLQCLREEGANVSYFIPTRKSDGYGMSENTIKSVAARGTKLIITVDNGIKSINEIRLCYELGMDVVVTDHHMCGDAIPECEAVVCHTVPNSRYPNDDICGAGTALKLVHALFGADKMKKYIPLAGIATIADVVPLLGENRVMVKFALDMLAKGECGIGTSILLEKAVGKKESYVTTDISFGFAPRLNAAGRMESAAMGVELLCSENTREAEEIADKLNQLNAMRQDEEAAICSHVIQEVDESDLSDMYSIILKSENWHQGVIGIAASRIADKYYRPALLFSEHDGLLTGSARSIPNVDLYKALEQVQSHFVRFGGHAYAAGITLTADADISLLQAELNNAFAMLNDEKMFIPRKFYEEEVSLDEITPKLVNEINLLAPFGTANPAPVFFTRSVAASKVKRIGRDGTHLSLLMHEGKASVKAVAFSMGDRFDEIMDSERLDILYSPTLDTFGGRSSIQLKISALRKSNIKNAEAYISRHESDFMRALVENAAYGNEPCEVEETTETIDKIEQRAWGTAVLCFTPEGAEKLICELNARGLSQNANMSFFANRETPCPYNAVIFAPIADRLKLTRYRNIIIYDSVPCAGVINEIKKRACNARILKNAYDNSANGMNDAVEKLFKGRDGIIPYYRMMKEKGPDFYNEAELERKLSDGMGTEEINSCRFAIKVCAELGFLERKDSGGVCVAASPKKRELEESVTYSAIKELASKKA